MKNISQKMDCQICDNPLPIDTKGEVTILKAASCGHFFCDICYKETIIRGKCLKCNMEVKDVERAGDAAEYTPEPFEPETDQETAEVVSKCKEIIREYEKDVDFYNWECDQFLARIDRMKILASEGFDPDHFNLTPPSFPRRKFLFEKGQFISEKIPRLLADIIGYEELPKYLSKDEIAELKPKNENYVYCGSRIKKGGYSVDLPSKLSHMSMSGCYSFDNHILLFTTSRHYFSFEIINNQVENIKEGFLQTEEFEDDLKYFQPLSPTRGIIIDSEDSSFEVFSMINGEKLYKIDEGSSGSGAILLSTGKLVFFGCFPVELEGELLKEQGFSIYG